MADKRNIIEKWITKHYKGAMKRTSEGWLICCPWHDDTNPSCNVYRDSGVFHCWRCKTKPPKEGFMAIGVPEQEVAEHFGRDRDVTSEPQKLPNLDEIETEVEVAAPEEIWELAKDEVWPVGWVFRGLSADAFQAGHPLFEMFNPRLVKLTRNGHDGKKHLDGLPRLSLSFPGDPSLKLFLRLSSAQDNKVINGTGVGGKFNTDTIPFGLTGWKLPDTCKALVLVEGPYDCLQLKFNLWKLGLWDVVEVVAILGTGQWKTFFAKFKLHLAQQIMSNGRQLVLAFDNDDAGADVTAEALKDLTQSRHMLLPESKVRVLNYFPVHDPGLLDVDTTEEAFDWVG